MLAWKDTNLKKKEKHSKHLKKVYLSSKKERKEKKNIPEVTVGLKKSKLNQGNSLEWVYFQPTSLFFNMLPFSFFGLGTPRPLSMLVVSSNLQ